MSDNRLFALMVFAMLLWGGGWVALKVLTPLAPLEVITFWRFMIMFLAFIPFLIWQKKAVIINKKSLLFATLSTIFNILFMIVAFIGIKQGLAGSGSIVITVLSPLITFILASYIFKHRFTKKELLGLGIGLIGGSVMLFGGDISIGTFLDAGYLYYLIAALIWAMVTIISQKASLHVNPIHYSFIISIIGTLILSSVALKYDLFMVFDQGAIFWFALIYLGVFAQTVATTIYYIASKHIGSAKSSAFMFVVPLSALLLGVVLLDEPVEYSVLFGGVLGLIAVTIISRKPKKKVSILEIPNNES